MTATMRRSLLDPVRGRFGLDRGMLSDDQGDEDSPPGQFRAYRGAMAREFARTGEQPPTFGEALQGMIGAVKQPSGDAHAAIVSDLSRAHFTPRGVRGFWTPQHLGLDGLLNGVTRAGTEALSGGSTYGFLVKPEYAIKVADKARHTIGPWSFCNIREIPPCREWKIPITAETTNSVTGNTGTMFGGFQPSVGHGELVFGSLKSDGKAAQVTATIDRMLVYSQVSADIWRDSTSLAEWFWYAVHTMVRNLIEYCMIQGSPTGAGPAGVLMNGTPNAVTVKVNRATPSQIGAADVDKLYQAIATGNTENAVWVASKPAMLALRALAVSGLYPFLEFPKGWSPDRPITWPTIYGRPVLQSPFASALGTPGDLLIADWSDYELCYIRPGRSYSDGTVIPSGALEVEFGTEVDSAHRGFAGFLGQDQAIEMRVSTEKLFDADTLAVGFKARIGGAWRWAQTATEAGITVGPAAVLSS
jgi:HK97 family phage major capsid protein